MLNVDRLLPYLRHRNNCASLDVTAYVRRECNCGLQNALDSLIAGVEQQQNEAVERENKWAKDFRRMENRLAKALDRKKGKRC